MAKTKTKLNPDIILQCRKCDHLLYIDIKKFMTQNIDNLPDCDECGEEGNLNWIVVRSGNFTKDYGIKNNEE